MSEARTDDTAALQRAIREKDDFIATIAHELRTPLTSILGWARMLKLGDLDEATYQVALESIERSTRAQVQLIEDLLDESRIAAGKLRLNVRAVPIRDVVQSAVDAIEPSAKNRNIRLEANLSPDPLIIRGDPTRLQQITANLLSNAVKFTDPGGLVTITLSRRDQLVRIEVTDTGRGIREDFLPHVFDRFRQDGSFSNERRGGLGLGLSIVRHLVRLHEGNITAQSAGPDQGATFTVELPRVSGNEALSPFLGREDDDRYQSLPSLSGIRVLVIEDTDDNRNMLAMVLSRCGAEVETAQNAAEALEKVLRWRPDVIVCDIGLPAEDGCALLVKIRQLPSDQGGLTPAMALTVHGRPEERERTQRAGFGIFRQKPVEPADLAFDISRLAGRTAPGV